MNAEWPPPSAPADELVEVIVNERDRGRRITGRVVKLWGRPVVIDGDGNVYCDYCHRFIPVADLADPFNKHPVGLRAGAGAVVQRVNADPNPNGRARMARFGPR